MGVAILTDERNLLCTPRGIRTPDHVVRTDVLYPAELWARNPYFTNSQAR